MSTAFAETTKALNNNPELLAKVTSAQSAQERVEILRAAGVDVPAAAEVHASLANMGGISGGVSQTSMNTPNSVPIAIGVTSAAVAAAAAA